MCTRIWSIILLKHSTHVSSSSFVIFGRAGPKAMSFPSPVTRSKCGSPPKRGTRPFSRFESRSFSPRTLMLKIVAGTRRLFSGKCRVCRTAQWLSGRMHAWDGIITLLLLHRIAQTIWVKPSMHTYVHTQVCIYHKLKGKMREGSRIGK